MTSEQVSAMQADNVTRKVILLYICEKLDSLTRAELMETALESMYMDYFQFTQLLDELLSEHLLTASERKDETVRDAAGRVPERFSLTKKGLAVLNTLRDHIPSAVSAYLHRNLLKREVEFKNENSVKADYRLLPDGNYEISFELYEKGNRYFSCCLDVPDRLMASRACENWKANASDLYPVILKKLLDAEKD